MSGARFDAAPVLAGLTSFQRATADHVSNRFYGPEPTRRFLVADETGLGKSLVAKGVIARTIEHLQDDDGIDRIDVVYVCSNADLARQNITRLDVSGEPHLPLASRLTLLAKHSRQLNSQVGRFTKPVNLISFTPGTSFEMGWQTGKAEERALLFLLLEKLIDLNGGHRRRAAVNLLRGQVGHHDRFVRVIDQLERELDGEIDPLVFAGFRNAATQHQWVRSFDALVEEMGRRRNVPEDMREPVRALTGKMRAELAKISVRTLEPDLVILDEFQRFRHLLDETTEAGELAHHLFNFGESRVLLLSATPYKPFTYAEESDDDHYRDFAQVLTFLANGHAGTLAADIATNLESYRHAAVSGQPVNDLTMRLREQLLQVMCRTERPAAVARMLEEHRQAAEPLGAEDLLGYVALRDVAKAVDGQLSLDYWKSAPYFINFCDGYQLATRLRAAMDVPGERARLLPLLRRTQRLDPAALRRFEPVDYGNARLRRLAADTVDAGWWQLLWVPPSLPYLAPGGPYATPMARHMTKRLVFSSWAATPTAVASLLSYEAERRIAADSRLQENTATARSVIANRLAYSLDRGRPQAMTTLMLFWPTPGLADIADPLRQAKQNGGPVDPAAAERRAADVLRASLPQPSPNRAAGSEAGYWISALARLDSLPPGLDADRDRVLTALAGEVDPGEAEEDPRGLGAHVDQALDTRRPGTDLPSAPPDLADTLAAVAMHSPANIAWRALHRIAHDQPAVTAEGHWIAAALLAAGLRSLFSRLETTLLLDKLLPDEVYWRAVLRYAAWGNLQAVLDEYLHHLLLAEGSPPLDDSRVADIATKAASAIALRPSRYLALNPLEPARPIAFTARFALRYGARRLNDEDARQPQVRGAFNSPFWPFVLTTTSVGQEGIDFHWWSHALLHWNTPASPVDFEQREGRIQRYAGHVVRRNIAQRHAQAIFAAGDPNPWCAAYRLATDETDTCGDFAPYWVYPGVAHVERHVSPYPMSADAARLDQLKDDVALYRLTFGQPRQEDLLQLLQQRGVHLNADAIADMRVDLRPPD